MRLFRHTTFSRYNLFLEISALILTSAILLLAVWFTLAEINRKYLELRLADALKVELFLKKHLDDARQSLEAFVNLSEAKSSPDVLKLFYIFSDIYHLDPQLRIKQVYKAKPDSKTFVGFSFSTGKLADYLRSVDNRRKVSEIMRGYEDDWPSVYFAIRSESDWYLGRLDSAYLQDSLIQFSQFSGTPVMLVAPDGFVMLSGDPTLLIPSFDLKKWAGTPSASRTLFVGDRHWIPISAEIGSIGTRIVTLIPTELLKAQRNALLGFLIVFMGGLICMVILKNRQLNRLVIKPLAAFAGRMRDLEKDRRLIRNDETMNQFEELADINSQFLIMAEAIQHREQSLSESEEKFHLAFDNANTGMCLVDMQGRLVQVNEKMCAIFGYSRSELEQMTVNDLSVSEDTQISPQFIHQAVQGSGDHSTFEKRYRHRKGHIVYGQVASSLVRGAQGHPLYFISQVQDISERKRYEHELEQARDATQIANFALQTANEELNRVATTDPLTGARNRRCFEQNVGAEIVRAQRYDVPLALIMFDIDHFKSVNDCHGHLAGDRVLIGLSHLAQDNSRAADMLVRWGGEEFIMMMPHCGADEAVILAEKLRMLVAERLFPDVGQVTASFGVAQLRLGETIDALLKRVDDALYQAKEQGRNRVVKG